MAPYSFRIARGLRTKAQVIRARLKENGRGVNMSTLRAILTVNFLTFPSVKFRKIWRTDNKYFTLFAARFSGKSI